jgi:hypothetical protein
MSPRGSMAAANSRRVSTICLLRWERRAPATRTGWGGLRQCASPPGPQRRPRRASGPTARPGRRLLHNASLMSLATAPERVSWPGPAGWALEGRGSLAQGGQGARGRRACPLLGARSVWRHEWGRHPGQHGPPGRMAPRRTAGGHPGSSQGGGGPWVTPPPRAWGGGHLPRASQGLAALALAHIAGSR